MMDIIISILEYLPLIFLFFIGIYLVYALVLNRRSVQRVDVSMKLVERSVELTEQYVEEQRKSNELLKEILSALQK